MKALLDKVKLKEKFSEIGIHQGVSLMVQSSLSSLGIVDGGATAVVEALLESAGEEGTVVMPAFRSAIRSESYSIKDCENCKGKRFCESKEPGTTGLITETMRLYPGVLRSCHPTCSWIGTGKYAEKLLEEHGFSPTPCGKGSPFFPLMELNGIILLLGVGINSFTFFHAVEDALGLPYLSAYDRPHRHATYTTSGRRIQYQYPQLLETALREANIIKAFRIGVGNLILMRARDIGSFMWQAAADNPWCFILRPRGADYSPFEDACIKTARMVKTWKTNPDGNAWEKLLIQSRKDINPPEFKPCDNPRTDCPAYGGMKDGYHRCAANDPPPWEKFIGYPPQNAGVATCHQCSWPIENYFK